MRFSKKESTFFDILFKYFFLKSIKLNDLMPAWLVHPAEMSRQNKTTTIEPMTLAQIKVAPLNALEIQKKIIPKHLTDLHDAVDEAIKLISREYTAKARTTGSVQMMNANGTPIVGAVYSLSSIQPKNYMKKYRGKKVICEMPCCTMYHPPSQDLMLGTPHTIGLREYEPQNGWIKVEPRSRRNKRLRAARERKLQNEYLYSGEDNDDYIE